MYWNLGRLLSEKKLEEGYGSGVVKQLSVDLKSEFPGYGTVAAQLMEYEAFL